MASNEVTLRGYVRKIELRFAAQSGKAPIQQADPGVGDGEHDLVEPDHGRCGRGVPGGAPAGGRRDHVHGPAGAGEAGR